MSDITLISAAVSGDASSLPLVAVVANTNVIATISEPTVTTAITTAVANVQIVGVYSNSIGSVVHRASDTVDASDAVLKDLSRTLSESVSVSEAFEASAVTGRESSETAVTGDMLDVSVSKPTSESVSLTDVMATLLDKVVTETCTTSDQGLITMQDYGDVSYFAEDYTGVYVSF